MASVKFIKANAGIKFLYIKKILIMKTIAMIPARGGSKGLKMKNIRTLRGKPLIERAIKDALNSNAIDKVYVTTDNELIQEIAINAGAECPLLRPAELAQSSTTTEDTLKYGLNQAEDYFSTKFDACVFLTATDVYRKISWINECIDLLKRNPDLESVFIGYATTKNFWEQDKGKWLRVKDWMSIYGSRQTRRSIIREDTGVCSVSRSFLWREGRRIGDNVEILVKDSPFNGLDIHTEFDLYLAEKALEYYGKN